MAAALASCAETQCALVALLRSLIMKLLGGDSLLVRPICKSCGLSVQSASNYDVDLCNSSQQSDP